MKSCPDFYWGDVNSKQCTTCNSSCATCKNEKICISCAENFFFQKELPENNCLTECLDGFYPEKNSRSCRSCNKECKTCDSEKLCNTCNINYYFFKENRECLSKCPDGYYIPENSQICKKCSENCKTCILNAEICTSCNRNLFYEANSQSCLEICPKRYYGEVQNNKCMPCDSTCLTCKGASKSDCLSCIPLNGVRLIFGYCTNKCPGNLVQKKNGDECIDINACFESLFFNIPKMFSIQNQNYKATIDYKIKDSCFDLAKDISFNWLPLPNSILNIDKTSIVIPIEKLKDGRISLNGEVYYNFSLIKAFTGSSILITYKVITYFLFKFI